jgi:RNA polymerase sigma-70 factor, ECF subfamily
LDVDDRDLKRVVRKASSGDREAAGRLFDHFHPRVYRYALAKLRKPSDAEDVAAETFARVLRDLGGFRWKGAGFEAWLFRIAGNLVIDHVRRAGGELPTDTATDDKQVDERTPETVALEGETVRDLNAMLNTLPEDQREVLVLRFAAGLDSNETAEVMSRNANAIRQLQFRALTNLRQMNQSAATQPLVPPPPSKLAPKPRAT